MGYSSELFLMAALLFHHGRVRGATSGPYGSFVISHSFVPESFSVCTQGLRPGLIYAAPGGADVFAVVRLGTIEVWDGASPIHK